MLEEDIDDTHFCCKCSSTIVGLENYVQHRKNNCTAKSSRSIAQVDHPYGAFDFSENTSYPIKNDEVEKGSKCLSYTYDLPYELGADVFFSSLELQSSSKRVIPSSSSLPAGEKSSSYKAAARKPTETLLSTQEHDDEWIESGNNSDNLIKAVNSISGNKKFDSPFKLLTFQHDSPDASDVEVDDDDDYEAGVPAVPAGHTGGKWKPENEPETDRLQWDSPEQGEDKTGKVEETDEFEHDLNPPPEHTKGKWVPGTTFSKILNKRQLKPSFEHSKPGKLYQNNTVSKRPICTQQIQISPPKQKQGKQTKTFNENIVPKYKSPSKSKSDKYKINRIKCEVCNLYLQKHSMGLHLISHQHYRKRIQKPQKSFEAILENIHQIVKESPFQCQPCHFYANRQKQFLSHWDSVGHITAINGPGLFWCNFCKFECLKNCDMKDHLIGSDHKEVMDALNRTTPIIIRKKTLINCSKCKKIFRYNIQLKRHICRNTVLNETESKFRCKKCGKSLKNRLALQRHQFRQHKEHSYFCSICEMEFETHKDKRKHNNSAVHKINFAILKKMEMPMRQCKVCGATCSDILKLKEHIKAQHPETKSLCRFCGKGFELPQDLTYHVRYKICQEKPSLSDEKVTSSNQLLTALARSPGISIFKDQIDTYSAFDPKSQHGSDDEKHAENEVDTQYKCKECKYSTKVNAELIYHELMHSLPDIKPDDKVTCPRCSKKFSQKSLRFHLRGHTDEKAYECKLCFAKFAMRQHLVQHTLRVHSNYRTKSSDLRRTPSFLCGTCGRVFKKKTDQGNMATDNVEGEKLSCPSCSQQSYKATFFKCNLCPASFVRKHNFIEHQKSTRHHEKDETPRTSNKDKEQKIINQLQLNTCQDFAEKSPSQRESSAHCSKQDEISASQQYSKDISQINLPGCSGESKFSAHLTNTIKFEDGEDYDKADEIDESILHLSRHQCDTCGKVFQKKYNLRQHITIHGKRDEQFSCPAENCIFVGRNASDLKTHMEVHSVEKTYGCDFEGCDYKGKTIRNLRRHAKIHSTEEEFKYFCPSCEFKTRLPGHIKRHMRIHTGEKPYKCPYCDYACSNSENLRKHVITTSVHPGRSLYECKLCNGRAPAFKTNYYKEYKTHLNNDHHIKPKADVGPSKE